MGRTIRPRSDLPTAQDGEYSFAGFRLETDGTLRRGESVVHLPPKELAALHLLLARAGQIVTPLQLKQALWGDVHVTADSVPKCLSSLRARLEPEACIQTVYKRGYRLTAEVRRNGAAADGTLPRLAIMPFATGYNVPEYLGAAVAEDTIARLSNARYPALSMLARDSVFTLASSGQTGQQLGETLQADLVLTGTISSIHRQFRLRAEMIRVEDGTQIWVEDLLVDQNRIAGVESELVHRLAYRLGLENGADRPLPMGGPAHGLSISAVAAHEAERETDPRQREAFETFQRGHHEWQTLERHRMQDGLQQLSRAALLDPSLIAAKVDLARLCVTQAFYGYMSPLVAGELVRRTADSILDIHRQAEDILPALGWAHFNIDRNLSAALWAFTKSAHLHHNAWNTRERAMLALSRHRFDEAAELNEAALRQDPFSPWLHARKAWILHLAGKAAESLGQACHGLELFPNHDGIALYASMILAFNGDAERAARVAEELTLRQPYIDLVQAIHAYTLACHGRGEEARTILERLNWLSRERFVLKSFTPAVYVALGDLDAALVELRAAAADRCPWFFQMLADPRLKPLHGHPEFGALRAILTRMETDAATDPQLED